MFQKLATIAAALAMTMTIPSTASAQWGTTQTVDGFEGGARAWWFTGNANVDFGAGLSHSGANNGWVRNTQGWNAVNITLATRPNYECTVQAWIRTSETLTDGYMTIRSWNRSRGNPILREIRLAGPGPVNPENGNYNKYSFTFRADAYSVIFYVGLWGNGRDSWMQVDDVAIHCAD